MRAKNPDKSGLTALKNAGDRDRTFEASQNPHGKEPCGLTFFFGPISDPLSYDKGYSYLLNNKQYLQQRYQSLKHICTFDYPKVSSNSSSAASLLLTRIRLSSGLALDSRFILPYHTISLSIIA